jgi:hypothetical protein
MSVPVLEPYATDSQDGTAQLQHQSLQYVSYISPAVVPNLRGTDTQSSAAVRLATAPL